MSAPESPFGLPTARDAMREAIDCAQREYWEGARMWLDIARELRHGEAPPARPYPRPLDGRSELAAEADLATAGLMPIDRHVQHEDELSAYAGEQASARFAPVHVPVEQPVYRTADTEIIRTDRPEDEGLPRCGQEGCGLRVELALNNVPAIWVHALTQQARCPVSYDRELYATPAVDARG